MPKQTRRRYARRRRSTRRLSAKKQKQTGGGKLDKLPVGPGSRKADGTPAEGFSSAVNLNSERQKFLNSTEKSEHRNRYAELANNTAYGDHLIKFTKELPDSVIKTVLNPGKYTDKYMNLISRLPSARENLEDAIPPKDLVTSVVNDFKNNWEFMYIMGHGVLTPEVPAVTVPERTYVRFNAPGGCRAVVGIEGLETVMAFPNIFTRSPTDPEDKFFKEMARHHFQNTGPLESFSSLAERAAVAANPYPSSYCETPAAIMSESTECIVDPLQKKQTIYGPGEKIQEMKINFSNNPYQMFMLGVYALPVPRGYAEFLKSVNVNLKRTAGYKNPHEMTPEEFDEAELIQTFQDIRHLSRGPYRLDDERGKEIASGLIPNLRPAWILKTLSLAEIFAGLGPVPAGKVRFLFINSCRGVPFTIGDTGLISNLLRGAPANDGSARGGAGTAAAAEPAKRLNIASRKNLAFRARRASLATETGDEDELEKLLEARRYIKQYGVAGPRYAEMKAIETPYSEAFDALSSAPDPSKLSADIYKKVQMYTTALTLIP